MAIRSLVCLVAAAFALGATQARPARAKPKPTIVLTAEDFTSDGKPRQFPGSGGNILWSPRSPVYRGDRLRVSFSMNSSPVKEIRVKLDGKSLAYLTKPPWAVNLDTSRLPAGQHIIRGEVRSATQPIMYGFAALKFFLQEPPETMVKASTEELIEGVVPPPALVKTDPSISVKLRSLDAGVDKLLGTGQAITVDHPITIYLDTDAERWAYSITRDDREMVAGGPMDKLVYIELAPRTDSQPGLLHGELTLRVWGVSYEGAYSKPVTVRLMVT